MPAASLRTRPRRPAEARPERPRRWRGSPSCNVGVIPRTQRPAMMSLRNAENACSATSVSRRIDPGVDPITTALQLAFFVLFGVTVFQFLRNRGPLELGDGHLRLVRRALRPLVQPVADPVDRADRATRAGRPAVRAATPGAPPIAQIRPVGVGIRRISLLGAVAAWEASCCFRRLQTPRRAVRSVGTCSPSSSRSRSERRPGSRSRAGAGSASPGSGSPLPPSRPVSSAPRSSSPASRASRGRRASRPPTRPP